MHNYAMSGIEVMFALGLCDSAPGNRLHHMPANRRGTRLKNRLPRTARYRFLAIYHTADGREVEGLAQVSPRFEGRI